MKPVSYPVHEASRMPCGLNDSRNWGTRRASARRYLPQRGHAKGDRSGPTLKVGLDALEVERGDVLGRGGGGQRERGEEGGAGEHADVVKCRARNVYRQSARRVSEVPSEP